MPKEREREAVLPPIAVALAACSWGTWSLVIRRVQAIGPVPAALESAIVMSVITLVSGASALRNRVAARRTWRDWACVGWFGIGDTLNVLLFFAAYERTVAVAVLTHYLTPVFVAMAAPLLLRERMTVRTAFAVAMSLAGLSVMLSPSGHVGASPAVWTSAALGTGSAVFYASNVVVNKWITLAFSTSEAMFWHGVVACLFAAAIVPRAAWGALDPSAAALLAVAAIGPGALGGMAFVWGLRRMPAAQASTLTLLEPLVAMFLGAAVLGEPIRLATAAGAAFILTGAVVVTISR